MGKYVDYYCENDAKELVRVSNSIIRRMFANLPQMYYDDLYSIAATTVLDCEKRYEEEKCDSFEPFLIGCLERKFLTEDTARKRDKRCNTEKDKDGKTKRDEKQRPIVIQNISLDVPIGEDGEFTIKETIASKFNTENKVKENQSEIVERYLCSLSNKQRKIVEMKMNGFSKNEIQYELSLNSRQYKKLWNNIQSFEKTQLIFENDDDCMEEIKMENRTQTLETHKKDNIYVEMLVKKMDNHSIKFNHALQRRSGRWTPIMRTKLISDMLQNNPLATSLVFAEQVINGSAIIWDLDGKQKCTTINQFMKNAFKISKKITEERRWNIKYDVPRIENGKEVVDEKGYQINDHLSFDIRGKYYSDLPDELKDRLKMYSFDVLQYFNCTEEDIAYHIERHNEGKQMNNAEKGLIKLGGIYASFVKDLSDMSLFTELGEYTSAELNNGTVDRVVVEGIMAVNFLNKWSKSQDEICSYLKKNASEDNFEKFEEIITDIEELIEERKDISKFFNSKDSFLWFALFSKFKKLNRNTNEFADFLIELETTLHNKDIDGKTYDSLCVDENGKSRATKDKYIVVPKIELLEKLMLDYLHISIEETQSEEAQSKNISILNFVRENISDGATDEDIDFCDRLLNGKNGLIDRAFKNNTDSKCLEPENESSLLAITVYSFMKDIDIDEWFIDYFSRTSNYKLNQKQNYIEMRNDLENYIKEHQKISA